MATAVATPFSLDVSCGSRSKKALVDGRRFHGRGVAGNDLCSPLSGGLHRDFELAFAPVPVHVPHNADVARDRVRNRMRERELVR